MARIINVSTLIFLVALVTPNPVRAEGKDFINIEQVLIEQHDWTQSEIGPVGQSYMIDLNAAGEAILSLHRDILQKTGKNRKTPICSIFTPGRHLVLSSAVFKNYNEEMAKRARKTWLLGGNAAMTEEMFLLFDKLSWFTYLREGLGSNLSNSALRNYFDGLMTIKTCSRFITTVVFKNEKIEFPNLILTMPKFVYVSSQYDKNFTKERRENDVTNGLAEMAMNAGEAISKGFLWIQKNKQLSNQELIELHSNMFSGEVDVEYLIMMGSICDIGGAEMCGNVLLGANEHGNLNEYFMLVKRMLAAESSN